MENVTYLTGSVQIEEIPEGAVALDGAVQGPVMGSPENGDRWSFDHHAGVTRMITVSTCEQVFTVIELGFQLEDRIIVVNDLDGDTLMSLWLIKANGSVPERGRSLVRAVGVVDAHGPAGYSLLNSAEAELVNSFYAGVIYPVLGRSPGAAQERREEWDQLIDAALERIDQLVADELVFTAPEPEAVENLFAFDRARLVLAECEGFGGFVNLYGKGSQVVALTCPAAGGTRRYTVGKISDLHPMNLKGLFEALNVLEVEKGGEPGWGGGSSIGGSPRGKGGRSSVLLTGEVWAVLRKYYR